MINNLLQWALRSRLVVVLLALALLGFGLVAFNRVNVEAYPDPAPPIVEVIAQFPGASAEEVERQVTIPLEVALSGMPGLKIMRSSSLFELCQIRNQFEYGVDQNDARQEVINRLHFADLPTGVVPELSPESPTGEILRYTLRNPRDKAGQKIYSLNDMKSLQDWTLERVFRRIPRIIDVTSYGGTIKRYEIQPDPDRMQRYGITLQQLKDAVASSNANIGGQYVVQGETVQVVRSLGLIGQGDDPMDKAVAMTDPIAARDYLRAEERRRLGEIRQVVISSTNNVPVRVDDVVDGGLLKPGEKPGDRGVLVSWQTRLGQVLVSRPKLDPRGHEISDSQGQRQWEDDDDVVQCIVLLRKGEQSLPALRDVEQTIHELNSTPGRLLPGVKIEPFYDRTDLIHVTTHTVRENLLAGMALVTLVLLMFLGNVRAALIVALNIPLALLFAFGVLFLRGKSANLLSIGAVDFGIIVDSSVIMVENIYRHLASGDHAELPIRERVLQAAGEIQRSLIFSTAIMVCAFLPLFTMSGPEGQIFGPMADTYAFALAGALVLAVVLSPVLCDLFLRNLRPKRDNLLVRASQAVYVPLLRLCLRFRWLSLAVFGLIVAATVAAMPLLGREFMPELEEGNLWIRGTFPLNISLGKTVQYVHLARDVMKRQPELDTILIQTGRPDDGTDTTGFYNSEFFVTVKPRDQWPILPGHKEPRTKDELVEDLSRQLNTLLPSVDWSFSQNIRDNVMEALSGVKGENSIKITGPELGELEHLATEVQDRITRIEGVQDVGILRILGQSNLALPVDRQRCAQWGVAVADVEDVIATAVGGKAMSQMIEGERSFDITLRWPPRLRQDQDSILKIPVELSKNQVVASTTPSLPGTPVSGPAAGPSPTGTKVALPSITGGAHNAPLDTLVKVPRYPLRQLLQQPGPQTSYVQPGASTIFREQGKRLIALKFDIRGRDLASTVREAQARTAGLVHAPYELQFSGEFQEMEQAEARLKLLVPLAMGLIVVLLYLAFRSLIDVGLVLSSMVALCCGGIWALVLTNTNFSISAAVGFISIFGVAVMNGLLLVSHFHRLRLDGLAMEEAVVEGAAYRLRPMMMTTLAPILGLLPAAVSNQIGAQTQRPLAIVVIGGMLVALLLNQFLTPVLYSIFRRRPPSAESAQLAE